MSDAQEKTKRSARPTVIGLDNDQCVWARAGVVKPFACLNAFDCTTCSFDKSMQKKLASGDLKPADDGPAANWTAPDRWLRTGPNRRQCRHMLTGRVGLKACARGFDCATCPYDQMIDDLGLGQEIDRPVTRLTAGFALADDYYFHPGHTWARMEYGGRLRLGLDDFALRLLCPVDEIYLPELGAEVIQGQPLASLIRGERRAEAVSPVDGVVVGRNEKVLAADGTAGADPYGDGWLVVVQPTNLKANFRDLLQGGEIDAWLKEEVARLTELIETAGGKLSLDGDRAARDISASLPEVDWADLTGQFL